MKLLVSWICLVSLVSVLGCDEHATDAGVLGEARLVLTADHATGPAPLTVNFTGSLYGAIDTLVICVPDMVMCSGYGKPCIMFCLQDSSQAPHRTYRAETIYQAIPGTYKAVMVLMSKQGLILSDSLLITVTPQ